MIDFRFEVFIAVARRLSFTKAAEELCITQPAVSKHIKELERQLGLTLFERRGNAIALSEAGRLVQKHAERMQELSRQLRAELDALTGTRSGRLELGASTTIAQYVLPPVLALFRDAYPEVRLQMATANTEQVEQALLRGEIAIGVIEGASRRGQIRYTPFTRDELILVSRSGNPAIGPGPFGIEELKAVPLVMREHGSGTLEVIDHALRDAGLRLSALRVEISLGSSEAIKSYLLHSDCAAFISRNAVARELLDGTLVEVRVKGVSMYRQLYFITPQGATGGLEALFMEFALGRQA